MPDYKVLPGEPPDQVLKNWKKTLSLSSDTLVVANAWLRAHGELLGTQEFQEIEFTATKDTGLADSDVTSILGTVFGLCVLAIDDAKFAGLQSDLKTLGLDEKSLANFAVLMEGLRFPDGELRLTTSLIVNAVVPRVTDVRAVCDLRAVFKTIATSDSADGDVRDLRALVPVVLMSLDIRDEAGEEKSVVVQFSSTTFERFQRAIRHAASQLTRITEIGEKATAEALTE